MLDTETKSRIDTARNILVGKIPNPQAQVEQITIALIYKFMDDMDVEAVELGGKRKFFSGSYSRYSWQNLMSPKLGGLEVLNLYSEAIQKMDINPNIPQLFREIFKNAYLPYKDSEILRSFLKTINGFNYDHSEKLGDAFEYLLSILGSQGDAGMFRTPRHIIDFMVYITDPQKGESILDPSCGTAGFLISSYKHILKNNSSEFLEKKEDSLAFGNDSGIHFSGDKLTPDDRRMLPKNIMGYDISPDMVRLSLVNLYLHGFAEPNIFEYDTLTSEDKWNEYYNVILANPPFMSPKGGIKTLRPFSIKSGRSEVLFVDYIAEHLTLFGRAAVIVPEGIIFQSGTAYKSLRKMLIEKALYAVVSLPSGVFNPYAGVKTSILLMDKQLAQKTDNILFVKIENDGYDLGAQRRQIDKNDLPQSAIAIKEYKECIATGKNFEVEKYTNLLIAPKSKISENGDYNLSGERYREQVYTNTDFPWVNIGSIISTITPPTKILSTNYKTNGSFPIIDQSQDLIAGWTDDTTALIYPEKPLVIFGDHTCVVKIISSSFAQGADGIKIILTSDLLIPNYLYVVLKYKPIKSSGYQRHFSKLKEYEIPLPPLEVQKEIVAEIEGYQKIIDGARQIVDNYKPRITIDPKWPMVELGEICIPEYGYTDTAKEQGDARFIRITDISPEGNLIKENAKFINLSKEANKALLEKGDILVARTGATYGKTMLFNEDYPSVFASFLIRLNFTKNIISPHYYWVFSQSENYWNQAKQLVTGGGQPQFNGNAIKKIKIPLPPIEVQKEIVARIEREQELVNANKELIKIFESKIKSKISSVWGEESE
ncbi:MAG TPA: N-6 DNA methylase [Ignavibacteriaceae bacterium]|nr:N-6 DNA methylase [Ignavibacteriaceae bacterium]